MTANKRYTARETMKILFLHDINGCFEKVYTLLKETIADMYLISGNILDMPFYSQEISEEFSLLHGYILDMKKNHPRRDLSPVDFSEFIVKEKKGAPELLKKCDHYLDLAKRADISMLQKYSVLEKILSSKYQPNIYLLAGQNDIDLGRTNLKNRNLANRCIDFHGLRIAGIGVNGESRTSLFSGDHDSINDFIGSCNPDIFIAPFDSLSRREGIPPRPMKDFLQSLAYRPLLIVNSSSRVMHTINTAFETVLMEPAPFGLHVSYAGGKKEGGFFNLVRFEGSHISDISLQKLANDRIYSLMRYRVAGENIIEELLDEKRFNALNNGINFDAVSPTPRAPEIRMFRDVKNFFRTHQTIETEKRVEKLASALEEMGHEFGDIAIDLAGSASMGLSQRSSDIDIILYIRAGMQCVDDPILCEKYKYIVEILRKRLKGEYEIEAVDYINLDLVEEAIRNHDLNSEPAQRFVLYRSICRPVNYGVLAPVEDLLNESGLFRGELEELIRFSFKTLFETTDTAASFEKYQLRITTLNINIPEPIIRRIMALLKAN